ncbi:RimK/LysX family protein [Photobacterium sp. SDRW27]|uniref:putative ATP-dependent zinc protease n=1 Tax=Photobacterium obscurum TaxID=2829490 RepID=UPI0022444A08|nr:RimK/LysX family protein [Photobacterium obscurum]MCW8329968.1 RimK/LysX family protein [Photobacterium obscurum]
MRTLATCFVALILAGCAQQTAREPLPTPEPETSGEVKPVEPTAPELKEPEAQPPVLQPEPEVTPEPKQPTPEPKPVPVTKTQDGKLILGAEEWVWLDPAKKHVKVKVDSEVKLSTIGVTDIQEFERDGNDWIKFKASGQSVELPVERWLKGKNGSKDRQAVVKLRAKLGELNELTEFALTAGKGIVLGINFIRDVAIVDGTRKYVQPKSK